MHPGAAGPGQFLFDELPVAGIPAAAASGGILPRPDRDRHDAGHPARSDRPVGSLGGHRRRHDVDGSCRLGALGRGLRHPVRRPLRPAAGPCQWFRGRLSPGAVNDLHPGDECRRPGTDGGPHRRFRAAGPFDRRHALFGDGARPLRHSSGAVRLGRGRCRCGFSAEADDLRTRDLRHRQQGTCGLSLRHSDTTGDDAGIHGVRHAVGLCRRLAGRLFHQSLPVDGRSLPAAGHCRRRPRRNEHPRRAWDLSRNHRRRCPDHAAAIHPLGHADRGGRPPDLLWAGHHRDAANRRA